MTAGGLDPGRAAVRVATFVRQGEQIHSLDLVSDSYEAEDVLAESHGIRLVFRDRDQELLRGTMIDFCDDDRRRGFVFRRPTAKGDSAQFEGHHPPDEQAVREALKQVIDPELGLNIVDLGLIYRVEIDGCRVHVTMTMTTPACPLSAHIEQEARRSIRERFPGTSEIEVKLVWSPPWNPQMMSDEAKQQMGWGKR
jgi:metal-sulfur cluster biosynthetic enzyme/Fe-S cluster assembly iron-binding protein IscA